MKTRYALVAADHQTHRRSDVIRRHAEVGGAHPVNLDSQFRLVQLQRCVGVNDTQLRRFLAQGFSILRQRLQISAAQVEVDFKAAAADVE